MKSTLKQQYMLSVLHSQYHACWCSSDFRSQGISRNGIHPKAGMEYSISSIRRVNHCPIAFLFRKHKNVFISQYWDGSGSWNLSSWKTRSHSSCSQNHDCWWPGDRSSQDISNYSIDSPGLSWVEHHQKDTIGHCASLPTKIQVMALAWWKSMNHDW